MKETTTSPDKFLSGVSQTLGKRAVLIITKAAASRFYAELGLQFSERPKFTLIDYVEEAKILLSENNEANPSRQQPIRGE